MPGPATRFDLDAIGAGLTVSEAQTRLTHAVASGAMVVTAPPGTGKTTFVPPLIANAVSGAGRVVVVQPRRVAARAAARRLAHLGESSLGQAVGFSVRGESVRSDGTVVEFVTPGILLRRLLGDPGLAGISAVVLDEVHERSLEGDLLLGMMAEVRELRDDLVLAAMSATLDATAVAELIGQDALAPIIDVPSPLHPLAIEYAPSEAPRLDARGVTPGFLDHVAHLAVDAQREDGCDAIVFVPAARDVDQVVRAIRAAAPEVDTLPLHGQLPPREQDRAVSGHHGRRWPARIVVSTSLAESSLTVPGVRLVIDAGLSREPRRDAGRGVSGLVTVSSSRASAEQRAGRAAREAPGRAIRAYSEPDLARMPATGSPEIRSADLTDAALLLASWGTPRGDALRLLTSPPVGAIDDAVSALTSLGLLDSDGRVTPLGAHVARLPAGAREGRALLAAPAAGVDPRAAAEIVAAMSGGHRDGGADLVRLVNDLRAGRAPSCSRWRSDVKRLERVFLMHERGAAPDDDFGHRAHREAPQEADAVTEVSPSTAKTTGRKGRTDAHDAARVRPSAAPGIVAALARPEWIARRVAPGSRSYALASGTRAALPDGSPLASSDWLAVWDAQRADGRAGADTGTAIRLAAPLDERDAISIGATLTSRTRSATIEDGRVRVRDEVRLGAIVLSSTPVAASKADRATALTSHVREQGLESMTWSPTATSLRARMGLLHREIGAPWPDVSDRALLDRLDDWVVPTLASSGASLANLDLVGALRILLPWPEAARLDQLVPERLVVPSGSHARIEYPAPDAHGIGPVVAVKLQEAFGLATTPCLVDGRVPVVFHLLSPARHPLAVTADLAGFWNGAYTDVRKEMRGRYPKHPWPEDPWSASATAKTTRAMRG